MSTHKKTSGACLTGPYQIDEYNMESHIQHDDTRTIVYGAHSAHENGDDVTEDADNDSVVITWPDDINADPLVIDDATITATVSFSNKTENAIAVDIAHDARDPDINLVVARTTNLPVLDGVVSHHIENVDKFAENTTFIK